MKNKFSILALAAIASFAAPAANAATLVETENFSFVPDNNVNLTFNQFNTMGGTLTLQSVTISIILNKTGGRLEADNDSEVGGTISLTHRVRGSLNSSDVNLTNTGFTQIGALGSLDATNTLSGQSISATTGDSTASFNNTGLGDYFLYEPADTSANTSGNVASGVWGLGAKGYLGTGTYNINFDAIQTSSVTGVGGLAQAFVPSNASGTITVTYTYVPEPSAALLGGLGLLALLRRRR